MEKLSKVRGRPKGSGIDDEAVLFEIAGMILADPELRPTTALKRLGLTNPSTIRRVRDKFKTRGTQIMESMKRQVSQSELVDSVASGRTTDRQVCEGAVASRSATMEAATDDKKKTLTGSRLQLPDVHMSSSLDWSQCAQVCTTHCIENQLALAQGVMRLPGVAFLLEQQAQAFNAMVAFYVVPPAGIGRATESTGGSLNSV